MNRTQLLRTALAAAALTFALPSLAQFSSRKEIVSLTASDFRAKMGASEDAPAGATEISNELDIENRAFLGTEFRTKATYRSGGGTWVHPEAGICFDIDEANRLINGAPDQEHKLAVVCIVACYKAQSCLTYLDGYGVTPDDSMGIVELQALMEAGQYVGDRLFRLNDGDNVPTDIAYPVEVLANVQQATARARTDVQALDALVKSLGSSEEGKLSNTTRVARSEAFGEGMKLAMANFVNSVRVAAGQPSTLVTDVQAATGLRPGEQWRTFTRRKAQELLDDTSQAGNGSG